jgi:hypothetical protein
MSKSKKALALTAAGSALLAPLLSASAHASTPSPTRTASTKPTTKQAKPGCAAKATTAASVRTHLTARSVDELAGGGHSYVYQLGAHRLTFAVPPEGFNALKATNAQLRAYGLPARPASAVAQARWVTLIGHLGHAVTPDVSVAPATPEAFKAAPVPARDLPKKRAGITTSTSANWSGYVSKQPKANHFASVEGTWIQPSIGATACAGATHLTWVGLGGDGTQKLIQDGTDQNSNPWFEYLGNNGTGVDIQSFPTSIAIHPGDQVFALTSYSNKTANWIVADETDGTYTEATLTKARAFYDGSSADFIDERTDFSSGLSPLANFGVTHWTGASAATASNFKNPTVLSSLTNVTQMSMVDPSNNDATLAVPTNEGVGGYTFETSWKNCS